MPTAIDETLLDERLAELEKAKTWSARVISKLGAPALRRG